MMIYGRQPKISDLSNTTVFDSQSFLAYLQNKLANIQDFVDSNLAAAQPNKNLSMKYTLLLELLIMKIMFGLLWKAAVCLCEFDDSALYIL